jgi:hypothetical protein
MLDAVPEYGQFGLQWIRDHAVLGEPQQHLRGQPHSLQVHLAEGPQLLFSRSPL